VRVLHVYKDYPPVIGGIENHLRLLAEHQVRAGLDVTVLVTAPDGVTRDGVENGVRVIRAGRVGELLSTPLSLSLFAHVRRLEPDVTHLQFPYPPGDLAHLLFGRSRATVVTYQSDIVRQRLAGWAYRPLQARLLARADRIIATSPNYPRSSKALGRVRHKCAVVPMGIETAAWERADAAEVDAVRRRFPGPLVLFVGRLRYYKGLEYLIRAMNALEATLVVIGDGRLRAQLEREALRSPAAERIYFLGDMPQELLPAHYAAADVLVLPSSHRSEAYGLVLLEAMACGTPVISTELQTGTSFVNLAGETGLVVPPRDPQALADALRACLSDPAARRRMGQSGRRRVAAEFRVERMVERVIDVYRDALHAAAPAQAAVPAGAARAAPRAAAPFDPTPLERALLLAVLYSDLFEYPLTESELRASLVGVSAGEAEFEASLRALDGRFLARREGHVIWAGREHLVDLRRERAQASPPRWRQAERYARWLRRVPFVRLVAVCGSQAMDNAPPAGDVDIFCITAPRRLWLAQVAAMLLRRPAALGGVEICPNYFLAEDALALSTRDLYTAHEALQAVPLWGRAAHAAFRAANAWTAEFLPGFDVSARLGRLADLPAPRLTQRLERALGGRAGEALDRLVYRVLLGYYSLRLWRCRFERGALRAAYRRDRQVVVGGGYAGAVAAAFRRRVRERLPDGAIPEDLLARLFPPRAASPGTRHGVSRLYGRLLADSYGARADGAEPRRGEP
jgi:rhamnosyl/mannosyltransferase